MIDLSDEYQRKDPKKIDAARVNAQNYLLRPEAHKVPGLLTFGYTNFQSGFVNAWTMLHKHISHIEIAVLLKGSQTYEVDGQRYVLTGNHFFVVPANIQHCAIENPHMSTFLYFLLDISGERPLFSLNEEHSRQLVRAISSIPLTICASTPTINHLIVKAFENLLSSDPLCRYRAQSQLATPLHSVIQQYETGTASFYDATFAEKITGYIEANISQRITLEEMSNTLGYSVTYLKKRFIQLYDMTPH